MRPLILLLLMTLPLFSQRGLAHAQSSGELARESYDTTDFTINIVRSPVEIRISNLEDAVFDFEPTAYSVPPVFAFPCVYATQPGTMFGVEVRGTVLTDGQTEYQYSATVENPDIGPVRQLSLAVSDPTTTVYDAPYIPSYEEGCSDYRPLQLGLQPAGDLTIETNGVATATITITVRAL